MFKSIIAQVSKLFIFGVFAFGVSARASQGTDVGFMVGIKNADFDSDSAGASYDAQTGFMAGFIATGELGGLQFRSGGYYAQRSAELDFSGSKVDFEIGYLDVPVTVLYNFNEMLGIFGGAVLGIKVTEDCSGAAAASLCDGLEDDIESTYVAGTVGLHAKFHPNWSGEISYEIGLTDIAEDTSANALSAGVIFIY